MKVIKRYVHFINIRVFSKESDNEDSIINKVRDLVPFDFKKEKIKLEIRTTFGFDNKKIHIISVSLKKEKHTSKVINEIVSKLNNEQKELLLRQLDTRLDDKLHFYLRLDKDKLLNNEYWITDSGNCFHFSFAIAAFPHRREVAKKIIEEILR